MSKELECLKRIDAKNYLTEREHRDFYSAVEKALLNAETIQQALLNSEKELKALEIIKKKSVWVGRLKSLFRKYNNNLDVLRFYNANMWVDYQLTKEEFNLLKEVLE